MRHEGSWQATKSSTSITCMVTIRKDQSIFMFSICIIVHVPFIKHSEKMSNNQVPVKSRSSLLGTVHTPQHHVCRSTTLIVDLIVLYLVESGQIMKSTAQQARGPSRQKPDWVRPLLPRWSHQ